MDIAFAEHELLEGSFNLQWAQLVIKVRW